MTGLLTGWYEVQIPTEESDFSYFQNVRTAYPAYYLMGAGVLYWGEKRPGHEVDHLRLCSAALKNK